MVAEKIVTFSLPTNFDVATRSASDIDKVKERLGKWRIQRRERDTKSSDTVNDIKLIKTYLMCFLKNIE